GAREAGPDPARVGRPGGAHRRRHPRRHPAPPGPPGMSKPKILFLTSGRDTPSSRFRVMQYLPRLRDVARPSVSPCRPAKDLTQRDFAFGGWPLGAMLAGAKLFSRLTAIARGPLHDLVYLERE